MLVDERTGSVKRDHWMLGCALFTLIACGPSGSVMPGGACTDDADCAAGGVCGQGLRNDGTTTSAVCMAPCPAGVEIFGRCPGGELCEPARDISPTTDAEGICFEGGGTTAGAPCSYELECAHGLACTPTSSGDERCRPTCATSADCLSSEVCDLSRCLPSR